MSVLSKFSQKSNCKIVYLDFRSALKNILDGLEIFVPIPSTNRDLEKEEIYITSERYAKSNPDKMYVPDVDEKMQQLRNQLELNDLARDLSLSKEKAELLSS